MSYRFKRISCRIGVGLMALVLAFFLLLSIKFFSSKLRSQRPEPVMMVQMVTLSESQPQPEIKRAEPKKPSEPKAIPPKPKPVQKPPVKPKALPKKPLKKPSVEKKRLETIPEPQTVAEPVVDAPVVSAPVKANQAPIIKVTVASLPTPVPIFKLTELPRFLNKVTPVYPEQLRSAGLSGTVKLAILIDETGKVRKVDVLQSAGALFDQAAIAAIESSKFLPAKVGSKAVAVVLKLPIKFSLQ